MKINDENFLLHAVKYYNNPSCCSMKEFKDDIKRFKYIKRLLRKYKKTGNLSHRLILNHIILLHNVFGDFTVPFLFFKIEEVFWPHIKTFLVYLDYLPSNYQVSDNTNEVDIPLELTIINILRKL